MINLYNLGKSDNGAIISDDNNYRYLLWRKWDNDLTQVVFIMLNPSTADGNKNDPTVKKCMKYAKDWGYGGIVIINLFAYRATNPKELELVKDPIGPLNDEYIKYIIKHYFYDKPLVVASWGTFELAKRRVNKVFSLTNSLHYLELSKDGSPKHPLYLRGNLKPKKF
jgi:hypothetical protein